MTRNEAIKLVNVDKDKQFNTLDELFIARLEVLGLIKFEEEKIQKLFEITLDGNVHWPAANIYPAIELAAKHGVIRLEEWPEGLVLWVGEEIKWKSWEKYYKKGDAVTIDYYIQNASGKWQQAGIIKE